MSIKFSATPEWGDISDDWDENYAREKFEGLSLEDAQKLISVDPVNHGIDLLYMPRAPLRFYVMSHANYILDIRECTIDTASAAGCLLVVCEARVDDMADLLHEGVLASALDCIANSQDRFDAAREIFGDFAARVRAIRLLASNHSERVQKGSA